MRQEDSLLLELDTAMTMVDLDQELWDAIDDAPRCQGKMHTLGGVGHDDGPAKWVVYSPCGCIRGGVLQCDGRAMYLRNHPSGGITCAKCRKGWPVSQWRFVPI